MKGVATTSLLACCNWYFHLLQ